MKETEGARESAGERPLELVELRDVGDPTLLADVYERLYLPSILVEEERQAISTFERRLGASPPGPPEPQVRMIVAGENLADPAVRRLGGYLILELYRESRTTLLAYVGTSPEFRRQGLMRRMYAFAAARVLKEAGVVRAAFAEIHVPGRIALDREPMATLARVRAFASLEALLVPIPYVQPALEVGQAFGTDLMLLSLPIGGSAGEGERTLSASAVRDFLGEYYRGCGIQRPVESPGFDAMLAALSDPETAETDVESVFAACQEMLPVARLLP